MCNHAFHLQRKGYLQASFISGWLAKLAVVGEPIPDRDFSNYEHENNEYCQNS